MSKLVDMARSDMDKFTSAEAGEALAICPTVDGTYTDTLGLAAKHHMGQDEQGQTINTKFTQCCVSERKLVSVGYPLRDDSGEVALIGHFVKFTDSEPIERIYQISETMPDQTLGFITCFLTDYE